MNNTKSLYAEKLMILGRMSERVENLRADIARLTATEEKFPAPDHSELFGLSVALDEFDFQLDQLATAVEPLAK